MMRILVTGGAGFVGSHVVDAYVAAGHEVAVVDNLSTGKRANVNPAARFFEQDIRDTAAMARVFGLVQPEVVNHHAAQAEVRRSVDDPRYDAAVNVVGTLTLLEAARAHGVRKVIYISSGGAVYGEPQALPCAEEHPIAPLSPYGASKYAVELYLHVYRATHAIATTVLRYANVYGPRQDPLGEAGVVAIFAGRMLAADPAAPPTVFGDGEQTRDYVYVGDCARANVLALEAPSGGVYNIGTGAPTSVNRLAALLRAPTGYGGAIVHAPERPGEVRHIHSDVTRARDELGWAPRVALREGLARTVDFFR